MLSDFIKDFFIQIIIVISGSILAAIYAWIRLVQSKRDLTGRWMSSYIAFVKDPPYWIDEEVDVDIFWGNIRMRNKDKENNYHADIAKLKYIDKDCLVGEYESKRLGNNDSGFVIFMKPTSGDYLYGYYVGKTEEGAKRIAPWVLGRFKKNREGAKKHVEEAKSKLKGFTLLEV